MILGIKCAVQVPVDEVLEVTVWDADEFTNDKCLGVVEIDIAEDVAKVPGGRIYKTWYLQVREAVPFGVPGRPAD